jgi:Tol biopolymer transport system component
MNKTVDELRPSSFCPHPANRRRFETFPAFSPAGRYIAFVSETDGNSEIYVMNSDGTEIFRVTRNAAQDRSPRFSRDGKKYFQ